MCAREPMRPMTRGCGRGCATRTFWKTHRERLESSRDGSISRTTKGASGRSWMHTRSRMSPADSAAQAGAGALRPRAAGEKPSLHPSGPLRRRSWESGWRRWDTGIDAASMRTSAFDNHLVADRLRLFDVGARGGIDPRWRPFHRYIEVVGFEPDPAECDRLNREVGS